MGENSTTRDAAVQVLLDQQAIRDAIMRYCRGCDRLDEDLITSAYHPDATDERSGQLATGAVIGSETVASLTKMFRSTNHQIGTQLIEVRGDSAAAESYNAGSHVLHSGQRLQTLGRYVDKFERRDGEWKIIQRIVVTDEMELLPASESERMGPPSIGTRDKNDPSYAFFGAVTGGA
jgi:hypothetical protein